jgi:fatty-acyl-CoA synthase
MTLPQYDWIAHHAEFSPDKIAQVCLHSGRRFSYAEMDARVEQLAAWMQREIGVVAGDRISFLAHNSTDGFEIFFAGQRVGAMVLPLNWRLALPELEFILNDAEPTLLIYGDEFAETALALKARCGIAHLLHKRDGEPSDYEHIMQREPQACAAVARALEDVWVLMYTSGTTGRPKGAQLTYQNQLFNNINCTMKAELTRQSTTLVFLPQFHVGGLCVYALPCFHLGATTMVMRQFDAGACLALLADPASGVSHTFGVPTNFLFMAQLPQFAAADFGHLVSIGIGGAAAPLSLLESYAAKNLLLQQGWGMTETCTVGTLLDKAEALSKIGSSGRKVMHNELRIVDDKDQPVASGETGELQIRGPQVTPGYWRRPEANASSFIDGWLRTGDAAYVDDQGFYFIVDRWKDMYISGGENVYPAETENVLYSLNGVAECAVIGVPDETWGEVGRAFVVRDANTNLDEKAVIDHCYANLAKYKVPRSVRFVPELPHNATGKIVKHELPRE